jgi:hypothetical protein
MKLYPVIWCPECQKVIGCRIGKDGTFKSCIGCQFFISCENRKKWTTKLERTCPSCRINQEIAELKNRDYNK